MNLNNYTEAFKNATIVVSNNTNITPDFIEKDYWISLVALGLGWNFLFVSSTALLITTYQDNEKYRAQAFNEFMVFGFQAIASLSAGWLLTATSWATINLMSLPILGTLLLTIWWSSKKTKPSY